MARFDVYPNPRKETAKRTPYLLDVQSNFLEDLDTRVVVPLRAASVIDAPVTRLNPALDIAGVKVVMDTSQLPGYLRRGLKRPVVNLMARSPETQNALNFLSAGV